MKKALANIILIFFGIFLFFILFELILGVSSLFYEKEMPMRNIGDENVRILTLGESTTAEGVFDVRSWPSEMDEYINLRGKKSYTTYNAGKVGVVSASILSELEELLDRYEPDIVIAMIGVNDIKASTDPYFRYYYSTSPLAQLRSVKFFTLLFSQWNFELQRKDAPSFIAEQYNDERAQFSSLFKTETDIEKAIIANLSSNIIPLPYNMEEHGFRLHPEHYYSLVRHLISVDECERAEKVLMESAKISGNDKERFFTKLLICYGYTTELEFYDYMIKKYPQDDRLLDAASIFYEWDDQIRKAETLRKKAISIRSSTNFELKKNYLAIKEILKGRDIQLIAMQYPTWDVEELKILLDHDPWVVYVDAAEGFQLEQGTYYDYFIDRFAGSFGHMKKFANGRIGQTVGIEVMELTQ